MARINLGHTLELQRRFEEAEEEYRQAWRHSEGKIDTPDLRGRAAFAYGRFLAEVGRTSEGVALIALAEDITAASEASELRRDIAEWKSAHHRD